MMWTKDVFDWRSPADKKDAIEKTYTVIGPSNLEFGRWMVNFLENLQTPFRVTAVGLSVQNPAVFTIIDAAGDEYDSTHGGIPFLLPNHFREFFKKTSAVLEEREDVTEVSPDAVELWSLITMLVGDSGLSLRGVPVKSSTALLKDLRGVRSRKLKEIDQAVNRNQKQASTHTEIAENLMKQRKKYECL